VLVESIKQNPKNYRLCQIPAVSGALVALDPHTGRVLALTGGWSFEISQFNRATQAVRQLGSAFKPFVYLAALERGLTPSTIIQDAPLAINLGYGLGVWKPKNYEKDFLGPITLRQALEKSRNLATIRIAHELVGMKRIVSVADRFGIMKNMPLQLAMVLGAGETTLLNLTNAYAMLANGGKKISPILLERVQDRHGRTLLAEESRRCNGCLEEIGSTDTPPHLTDARTQVSDPVSIYQIISILQGAIDRGTGRAVRDLVREHPLAGKTGSTNDFKDALFIGCTPDLVVGIRLGFDDSRPLGPKEAGARVAAPIFGHFMQSALKGVPPKPFRMPPGVRLVRVDLKTGQATTVRDKSSILEAFKVYDSLTPSKENIKSEGLLDQESGDDLQIPLEPPPAEEAEGIY
jgi:penicillin-binding protein 1A